MNDWYLGGYFVDELPLRRSCDMEYRTLSELSIIYGNPDFFLLPAIPTRPKNPPNLVQQKDRIQAHGPSRVKSPVKEVQEPFALAEDEDVQAASVFDDVFSRKSNIAAAIKQSSSRPISALASSSTERSIFNQANFDPFGKSYADNTEKDRDTVTDWKKPSGSRMADYFASGAAETQASEPAWGRSRDQERPQGSRFQFTQKEQRQPESILSGLGIGLNDHHYEALLARQRQLQADRAQAQLNTQTNNFLADSPLSPTRSRVDEHYHKEPHMPQSISAPVSASFHSPTSSQMEDSSAHKWMTMQEEHRNPTNPISTATLHTGTHANTEHTLPNATYKSKSPDRISTRPSSSDKTRPQSREYLTAATSIPVTPTLATHGLHSIEGSITPPANIKSATTPLATTLATVPSKSQSTEKKVSPQPRSSSPHTPTDSKQASWSSNNWEQPKVERKMPSLRELQEQEAAETRKRQAMVSAHQQAQALIEQQNAAAKPAEIPLSWANPANPAPTTSWASKGASGGRGKTLAEIQKEQQEAAKQQTKAAAAAALQTGVPAVNQLQQR